MFGTWILVWVTYPSNIIKNNYNGTYYISYCVLRYICCRTEEEVAAYKDDDFTTEGDATKQEQFENIDIKS